LVGEVDWEEALERIVADAFRRARLEGERLHYERVRRLRAPTAKLVYVFLKDHQPQSFASIHRTLGVSKSAGLDAMDELVEVGFVVRDEEYLYWVSEFRSGDREG